MHRSTLSLTSTLDGVGGQCHASAALPPGKDTRYPLYRRVGGPQGRSGQVWRDLPSPGLDPRTVQPVGVAIPAELSRPLIYIYIYMCVCVCVCVSHRKHMASLLAEGNNLISFRNLRSSWMLRTVDR